MMADYIKPSLPTRIMNRVVAGMGRLGFGPPGTVNLEVRRRNSGGLQRTPVTLVEQEGERWLVSPRGETQWVKNLRAAGGVAYLSRGRRREKVTVEEVPAEQRAPILKAYLRKTAMATRGHFGFGPDAPLEEFARIAPRRPVFRIMSGE